MKTLDVPFKSISDMKKAPMDAFNTARESNNGVYILNRNQPVGVALTPQQYEALNSEIEALYDRIDELIVKERLAKENVKTYSVKEATGVDLSEIEFDKNDGWE
ncbi:hypothetical protein [Salinicoccus albus]|uniref:hypothetical protein n=1 Tax=Salinicoccus albus TaxID=418756 RepID=UPI00037DC0F2|nr:hypothetical protein [Salinicoccus albus]